jgi:acyl dehydratase
VHELSAASAVKISAGIVGTSIGPHPQPIDARWLMAYAAALGETAPEYFDTTRADGIVAHPLFAVCYEWPLALDLRDKTLGAEVATKGVHATHDLTLYRRPRAGDHLRTTARVLSVESRPPGAYVVSRFETVDARGEPVSTTDHGSIYRGVPCEDARASLPAHRDREELPPQWSSTVAIPPTLAHVYTECARIWNPIHTDKAVAAAAGLPDIILHGTATLALAVSAVLKRTGLGPRAAVTRIRCRFGATVALPSAITVTGRRHDEDVIAFQALTADGRAALRDGCLVVTDRSARRERSR